MSTLRCLKMRLPVSSRLEIGDHAEERIAPGVDIVDQFRRQVLMHAADPEIGRMHARAGGALVKHHQLFALFKAPQRRGQRADVHRLRGDVEQMRQDAADLAIQHPDQLPAARHRDAEQLFRRQTERMLLIHRRDIVEPVEIRDRLQIGLVLDQLFGAAMQAGRYADRRARPPRRRAPAPDAARRAPPDAAGRKLMVKLRSAASVMIRPSAPPSHRPAGPDNPRLPTARENRICGIPD